MRATGRGNQVNTRAALMRVKIIQGEEAREALRDEEFGSQWARLYEACPWATRFQSPGFVIPWCRAYGDRYRFLLVCEFSPSNELIGLLAVAIENASGRATLPGAHQAEYKTWLALPSNGSSFIEQALQLLARETGIVSLSFRYVPPGTPLDWTQDAREFSWFCEMEKRPRAIIRVSDAAEVADYLKRKNSLKSTKSKWSRLKRLGKIDFQRISDASELTPVFDQLIAFYEIRQEAIHGKRAFQDDPAKKPFHLALLETPNLLHVTLLKVAGEIVSASFGVADGKTYSLAMSMFSPAYACYSPVMLHFLLLVEQLHKEGFSVLDLTAGADPFKERFAAEYDSVQVLSLYARRNAWIKHKVRQQGEMFARRALHAWGIAPNTARLRLRQFLRTPLRMAAAGFARAWSLVFRSRHRPSALRIYAIAKEDVPAIKSPPLTSRDCLADLLAFYPAETCRARQSFLAESLTRFKDGWHSYTRAQEGRLRYCGWLIESQKQETLGEDAEFQFPAGSVVLRGDYSDPNSVGNESLEDTLGPMLHDAASIATTNHIYLVLNAGDPVCQALDSSANGWIPLRGRRPCTNGTIRENASACAPDPAVSECGSSGVSQ